MQTGEGIEVREAINQGFVRVELATLSDDDVSRVYSSAAESKNFTVLKRKANLAIDNYIAAISCFLRVIPHLADPRSEKLVRDEVAKMMKRLDQLRGILKEAQQALGEIEDDDPRNSIAEDLKAKIVVDLDEEGIHLKHAFEEGTEVDVTQKNGGVRPGLVVACNLDGTYLIEFTDDGSRENSVIESRLSRRKSAPTPMIAPIEEERKRILSEIVESERNYVIALRNLIKHYVVPLANPSMWGGTRSTTDTVFSTKVLTKDELRTLCGNIEEIAGIHELFLAALDKKFNEWEIDQRLGAVFIQYAPFFKIYMEYSGTNDEKKALINKLIVERAAFVDVLEIAKQQGAQSLEVLMERPLRRFSDYKVLLRSLLKRTPKDHPDYNDCSKAYFLVCDAEESVNMYRSKLHNQTAIVEIQAKFSPPLALAAPHRIFIRAGKLNVLEKGQPVNRFVWLFNDIIVSGRESRWLAVGYYRHVSTLVITRVRDATEYGASGFEIKGKENSWICFADSIAEKDSWIHDMRGFLTSSSRYLAERKLNKKISSDPGMAAVSKVAVAHAAKNLFAASLTPPPIQSDLPEGWVKLFDSTSGRPYYYNESENMTSWDPPTSASQSVAASGGGVAGLQSNIAALSVSGNTDNLVWYNAQVLYDFDKQEPGDLSIRRGELIQVKLPSGFNKKTTKIVQDWIIGKNNKGEEGNVPGNRVQLI